MVCRRAGLVFGGHFGSSRRTAVDQMALQPPHNADRHDAGCRCVGFDNLDRMMTLGVDSRLQVQVGHSVQSRNTDARRARGGALVCRLNSLACL